MELHGATINFLGDSITFGVGASCTENRYADVLAHQFGLKKANVYGISASRIARQLVMTDEPADRDFCMRVDEWTPPPTPSSSLAAQTTTVTAARRWACPPTGSRTHSTARAII